MPLTVQFEGTAIPAASVAESIEAIAAQTTVLSLATSDADGIAHANMAFFALGPDLDLFFVSEPSTRHGRNVSGQPRCSAAIWLSPPEYGEHLQGMQLTGECTVARDEIAVAAFAAYSGRFPTFGRDPAARESYLAGTAASSLYRFRVSSLTLVDEPRLGRRNYLSLDVMR
jgi:uncharacterized protein